MGARALMSCFQHKTIESVLERGEKLDNLVERSNALSAQSKMFYKTAKKVRESLHASMLLMYISAKLLLCDHVRESPAFELELCVLVVVDLMVVDNG
jgi:hypothetical protein